MTSITLSTPSLCTQKLDLPFRFAGVWEGWNSGRDSSIKHSSQGGLVCVIAEVLYKQDFRFTSHTCQYI